MSPSLDEPSDLDLPDTVLARHGAWTLRASDDDVGPDIEALQAAFVALFPACVDALAERWPLPDGVEAHAVLAQEQACLDWGVDEDALGFHAVLATVQEENEDTGDIDYRLSLPGDHRCYVNLAGVYLALQDNEDDQAARLSALMTLPHEMAHVALFARHTQGRSPLQVFDEDGGEAGIQDVQAAIEEIAFDENVTHHEDAAEAFAADAVDAWILTPGAANRVDDIQARPLARRPGPRI